MKSKKQNDHDAHLYRLEQAREMIELYKRENRRVSARKCNRDGRRAPAPDGAAWGECVVAQFSLSLRLWMPLRTRLDALRPHQFIRKRSARTMWGQVPKVRGCT